MNKTVGIILGIVVVVIGGYLIFRSDTSSDMTSPSDVSGGTVEYADSPSVEGFLAKPATEGKHPAVILIHEWWGLNDNMRALAKQFAAEGYVALAVDMYDGKIAKDTAEAGAFAGAVRADMDGAFENLESAVEYLKTLPEVDAESIASVGWCFGGGWSYQMAKNDLGVKASVMYYGQFDPHDDFSHMKADILGHFGEEDRSISVDKVNEFQVTLKTLSGDHEVFIYPNAGHGFANEGDSDYVSEAAELAWDRTITFLKDRLIAE